MPERLASLIGKVLNPAVLLVAAVMAAGCATVTTSDGLVPQAVHLPAGHQGYEGSVQVNTQIADDGLGAPLNELVSRDLLALCLKMDPIELSRLTGPGDAVYPACGSLFVVFPDKAKDWPLKTYYGVSEFSSVGKAGGASVGLLGLFKEALEKSLLKERIFSRIAQGTSDYVLDVWIDRATAELPSSGIGAYRADIFSIWRLTRRSDGRILACDYVTGRGVIARGMSPYNKVSAAVIQDTIGKGLSMLADGPGSRLSALNPAGVSRRFIGGGLPGEAARWNERVGRNWSMLHQGMTIAEAEEALAPFRISHPEWDRQCRLIFSKQDRLMLMDFRIFKTEAFTLAFMSPEREMGKSMEEKSFVPVGPQEPPRLLIWRLEAK